MKQLLYLSLLGLLACNSSENKSASSSPSASTNSGNNSGHWEGAFTNGMKETFISFDISEDGKKLENLEFKGYWRCDGKLEQDVLGPEKSFDIIDQKVDGTISEPEDGGATAVRYELHAIFNGEKAEGRFRMNLNALACDTYELTWTAEKK
jgi:hypothetical protein